MDSTERAHPEQLLQNSRAHLHELEKQAAAPGLVAPPYVAVQLAEYRRLARCSASWGLSAEGRKAGSHGRGPRGRLRSLKRAEIFA